MLSTSESEALSSLSEPPELLSVELARARLPFLVCSADSQATALATTSTGSSSPANRRTIAWTASSGSFATKSIFLLKNPPSAAMPKHPSSSLFRMPRSCNTVFIRSLLTSASLECENWSFEAR